MVDARHPVGRRRPFEKHERGRTVALRNGFFEYPVPVPISQFLAGYGHQVQSFVLFELFVFHNFILPI